MKEAEGFVEQEGFVINDNTQYEFDDKDIAKTNDSFIQSFVASEEEQKSQKSEKNIEVVEV